MNSNWFKPPFGKRHIIVLASITTLAGVALLALFTDPSTPVPNPSNEQSKVNQTDPQALRKEYTDAVEQLDEGNEVGALLVNDFQVIDVRSSKSYSQGHIAGSDNIALADLKNAHLREGVTVVIYGDDQARIDQAVDIVKKKKVSQVEVLNSSLKSLEAAGYTIVKD